MRDESPAALGSRPGEALRGLWALYEATNGTAWHNSTGWSEGAAPCAPASNTSVLFGVQCRTGHVSSVRMGGNGLAGTLPTQVRRAAKNGVVVG